MGPEGTVPCSHMPRSLSWVRWI